MCGPFQRGPKVHVGGTVPAEGVPSGLHPQDLARCYGWKFPAHAMRERRPALRAGCPPSTEQWRKNDKGASVQAGACPLSLTSITRIKRKSLLNHMLAAKYSAPQRSQSCGLLLLHLALELCLQKTSAQIVSAKTLYLATYLHFCPVFQTTNSR